MRIGVAGMPGPKPPEIVLTDAEHHELERLVCAQKTSQALVRRARVVLLAAMEYSNTDIAERVPMDVEAVGLWRRRWNAGCGIPLAEVSVAKRLPAADADLAFGYLQPWRISPRHASRLLKSGGPATPPRPLLAYPGSRRRSRRQDR